ncbi:hypothetical protein [Amycolatopsis tolypomycina]|uniref:Uncharacterized protein n=1 Tax=Amycolatopsis tolypomycina TaxID=208445 RepID=A0A1H4YZI7_9PSEU|nr:hypothetical protein [Amycolatopsis tolypomycina]SED23439.1 hypothetical protein SAMN04489727_7011 [Amycolatopsis tolypomycina]
MSSFRPGHHHESGTAPGPTGTREGTLIGRAAPTDTARRDGSRRGTPIGRPTPTDTAPRPTGTAARRTVTRPSTFIGGSR